MKCKVFKTLRPLTNLILTFRPFSSAKNNDLNTHIDVDAIAVEDGGLGVVRGDVAVELVAVAVPLDRVELVAL